MNCGHLIVFGSMVFSVQWQVELCTHSVSTALWTCSHITTLAVCLMSNIPLPCSEATCVPSRLWSFLAVVLQETAWGQELSEEKVRCLIEGLIISPFSLARLKVFSAWSYHTDGWSFGLVADQPNRILGLYPGQRLFLLSWKELAFHSWTLTDGVLSFLHSTPWRSYPKTF